MVLRPFLAVLALTVGCSDGRKDAETAFMPENDLYKQDTLDELSNISEDEFNEALAQVEAVYKPIVAAHGAKLIFVNDWRDPTVNAYATRTAKGWEVHNFGGLARREELSRAVYPGDSLQLVACHELGHHLAGFPFYPDQGWPAAVEGQSDYFAVQACGRLIWHTEKEKNLAAAKVVHPIPKKACDEAYKGSDERHLCYRIAAASKSLADLLSYGRAKYDTPDKTVVWKTTNSHPAGQCRLDTYLSANICPKKFDPAVIPAKEKDEVGVLCNEKHDKVGARPRCWFKPGL